MAASCWGFVLMALHLGLHWGFFLGLARKAAGRKAPSRLGKVLLPVPGACVALYGLAAFVRRGLPSYMLLVEFVFLDYGEPMLLFYLDYLAMMGIWIFLSHYGGKLLRRRTQKSPKP